MKKWMTMALAGTMFTLSACGGGPGAQGGAQETSGEASSDVSGTKTITLTMGIHVANPAEQEPAAYQVVQAFMKANPDVKVEMQGADTAEHVSKMKAAAQAGTLPDVFWMLPAPAREMADAGLLLDLSEFMENNPDEAAGIFPNMVANYQLDGKQYGLPYQSLVTGLWYNKNIFADNGVKVPETYDELLAAAQTFTSKGIVTIAKGGKDAFSTWAMQGMLNRFGYFDKIDAILAKEEKFNNPDFVRFFGKLEELTKAGAFPENVSTLSYFQAVEMFMNGKAAMLDAGVWEAGKVDEAGIDAGWSWGPTFSDGVGNQKVRVVVATAPLVANAKVKEDPMKYDAVMRFYKFWYSQEGAKVTLDHNAMPAVAFQGEYETSAKAFGEVLKQIQDASWEGAPNQPDLAVPEIVGNAINDGIYGVINGIFTPEQAVDYVDEALGNQ